MDYPKLNVDESKLNEFMGKALGDMGAAINTALVLIGDRLGLYKAMAGAGPMTRGIIYRINSSAVSLSCARGKTKRNIYL